jgi:hypothetical protein
MGKAIGWMVTLDREPLNYKPGNGELYWAGSYGNTRPWLFSSRPAADKAIQVTKKTNPRWFIGHSVRIIGVLGEVRDVKG